MIRSGLASFGTRRAALLFAAVFLVHLFSPAVQVADSRLSVYAAGTVIHHGNLDLDQLPERAQAHFSASDYDVLQHDDELLPFFPYAPMLLLVPAVAAAEAVGVDPFDLRLISPNETWFIETPMAALVAALTTIAVALLAYALARGADAARRRTALLTSLLFAFGTAAWSTGSRAFWQHTPAMLLVALALLDMVWAGQRPRSLRLAGAAVTGAYIMRPTSATVVLVVGVWALVAHRDRLRGLALGATAVAVPFVLVNLHQYGALLPPYYNPLRLGTERAIPFEESLAVHLVSPSRGLLIYTPVFLLIPLGVRMARRAGERMHPYYAASAIAIVHWIVVASYGSSAGASYGARFFTEITPALMIPLVPVMSRLATGTGQRLRRRGAAVLVVASVLLAGVGATTRSAFCWSASPLPIDSDLVRLWDLRDPQMLRPARDLIDGRSVREVVVGACERPEYDVSSTTRRSLPPAAPAPAPSGAGPQRSR